MAAKKSKQRQRRSKKIAKKEKSETKISDKDLRKLQRELRKSMGKSILIEKDINKLKRKLRLKEPVKIESKKKPSTFYRKFVFKCGKCISEFEHTARIPMIEHKVVCPKCKEEYTLKIKPLSGEYEVKVPRGVKLVK
ncbi:MAG: hypothetical protein DRO76_05875 [Candidatus Altiarchaeales archaeon]|nr:MAG: hypothetical protein DRO76_05875 [Candidatus Altiarchaeales archaeon]HDI73122.1 hypothetical protein [Candidatus Altiarchaeales archaeon]